jgi:hypothetical protein
MEALTEAVASSLAKSFDEVGEASGLLVRGEVASEKLGGLDGSPSRSPATRSCRASYRSSLVSSSRSCRGGTARGLGH